MVRLIAFIKASLYVLMNYKQIQKDFTTVWEAIVDLNITEAEAKAIQATLGRHIKGLGL